MNQHLIDVPPGLDVIACWALISNGYKAIPAFTLHRYTNKESEAEERHLDRVEEADKYVPEEALCVHRANGDLQQLMATWLVVDPAMRELLLTDPSFSQYRPEPA